MRLLIILFIPFLTMNLASAEYLFVEGNSNPNKNWQEFSSSERLNLKNLYQILIKSKTGKSLLKKAKAKAEENNETLYDIVSAGDGSLTDTTLTRRFSPHDPDRVIYESQSKVFLNKDLSQYEALLDLAHELTHYVYRKNFNPYVRNFSLSEFIKNTIEGTGGEVQAFMMECRVHNELFPGRIKDRFNCMKILDQSTGQLSFKKAVTRFYQVGAYFDSFDDVLNKHGIKTEFPEVSGQKASFVSSAYGIPYPVAAFEEYLSVLNKVCENDKRRLGYLKKETGRTPASVSKFESDFKFRCKDVF